MDEVDELEAAMRARAHAAGVEYDPADYLDLLAAIGTVREYTHWYRAREGEGPWCWRCGKKASLSRKSLTPGLYSHHCQDSGCLGPGAYLELPESAG